jgi:hypothetical protein
MQKIAVAFQGQVYILKKEEGKEKSEEGKLLERN